MTTAEETGMFGVAGMHPEYLNGKVLLNLDTDEEGEFLVSCAGGKRATLTLPISRCSAQSQQVVYQLAVKGLKGGHSGGDIHLERGNANKILARLLDALRKETEIYLIDYQGGSKDNVITREAEAKIAFNRTEIEKIEQNFQNFFKMVKAEYDVQDAGLTLTKHQLDLTTYQSLTGDSTTKVIDLLYMLPHGVINMSQHIQGLVETSLNMGVVQLDQAVLKVTFSLRSSVASKKEELANRLAFMAKIAGAAITFTGDYPAWRYNENSKIRDLASKLYEEMYGVIPEIKAIHAGLECGYILEKLPHLDMIAFGPNGYDIHTPDERMSITSMRKIYEFLCSLLKNMKSY
jgi:dipeptidase D